MVSGGSIVRLTRRSKPKLTKSVYDMFELKKKSTSVNYQWLSRNAEKFHVRVSACDVKGNLDWKLLDYDFLDKREQLLCTFRGDDGGGLTLAKLNVQRPNSVRELQLCLQDSLNWLQQLPRAEVDDVYMALEKGLRSLCESQLLASQEAVTMTYTWLLRVVKSQNFDHLFVPHPTPSSLNKLLCKLAYSKLIYSFDQGEKAFLQEAFKLASLFMSFKRSNFYFGTPKPFSSLLQPAFNNDFVSYSSVITSVLAENLRRGAKVVVVAKFLIHLLDNGYYLSPKDASLLLKLVVGQSSLRDAGSTFEFVRTIFDHVSAFDKRYNVISVSPKQISLVASNHERKWKGALSETVATGFPKLVSHSLSEMFLVLLPMVETMQQLEQLWEEAVCRLALPLSRELCVEFINAMLSVIEPNSHTALSEFLSRVEADFDDLPNITVERIIDNFARSSAPAAAVPWILQMLSKRPDYTISSSCGSSLSQGLLKLTQKGRSYAISSHLDQQWLYWLAIQRSQLCQNSDLLDDED